MPKALPSAMVAGVAELVAGWVLDGRATQLPELRAPLVEIILTPPLGLAAAARAADAGAVRRRSPTAATRDDRHLLMDAFAEAVARDGLSATRLSDVAQQAGVELDVARALFTDELDCATQALNAWAGQLVVIAAGAFLTAAGDPPLAAHRALEAALNYIAAHPRLRGAGRHRRARPHPRRLGDARPLHLALLPAHRGAGPGRQPTGPAAAGGAGSGAGRRTWQCCAASLSRAGSPSFPASSRRSACRS